MGSPEPRRGTEDVHVARSVVFGHLLVLSLFAAVPAFAQSFRTLPRDSTGSYTLTLVQPTIGTGTCLDAVGAGADPTGNDFGCASRRAAGAEQRRLSLDLLPTQKWPNGAQTWIRLRQDATNYYRSTTATATGRAPAQGLNGGGGDRELQRGLRAERAYHVSFDFAPVVHAVGLRAEPRARRQWTRRSRSRASSRDYQQTTWSTASRRRHREPHPTANAGASVVETRAGAALRLGSDIDGTIASYSWQQLSARP